MMYRYDQKTDVLVLIMGKGRLDLGHQSGNIIVHHDKAGTLLEIEILDARKTTIKILSTIIEGSF
jgi:uncharacterized protein YuzE